MSAQHTPEPWRRGSDELSSPELFSEVYGPNGVLIATCHAGRASGKDGREAVDYARGNARRIVQCVNAFAGVPSEVLARGQSGGLPWSVADQIDQRVLRDELVAALHQISLCSVNSASSKEECGRIARAALAKVLATGSAS
jgi:hypothetical protein